MIIPAIEKRTSVRHYEPRPIEPAVLARVLEAARLAPTAKNRQEWRLFLAVDPAVRQRLVDQAAPHQPFLREAPVLIAACALDPSYVMRCGHPSHLIDLAIVLDHLSLQAAEEGLGTCWIGSFDEAPARAALGIPEPVRIVQLMALGYPAGPQGRRPRKPLAELVVTDRW